MIQTYQIEEPFQRKVLAGHNWIKNSKKRNSKKSL